MTAEDIARIITEYLQNRDDIASATAKGTVFEVVTQGGKTYWFYEMGDEGGVGDVAPAPVPDPVR